MKQQDFFNRYNYSTRNDKLGGGTFGNVYKAYDKVLDKTVAIKIAEVKVFGNKEFSLLDEFEAIKGLPAHQNIANYDSVYTFEQPNGVYDYAIIQYYPDGNLSQLIKHKNLSFTEKEEIALQVLDGLAFLHKHKVVHRDMKPSNVLVHKRSISGKTEYIPKIADFGLSKKADPNAQSRFTNSFGGGTLEYSSPEQLKGRNLRFNTDLWAWAVISYELLTGKMLFQATGNHSTGSSERDKEIYEQITSKDISSLLSELPKKWQEALSRCLERNPDNRIKTAKEIKAILVDEIPVQDTPTQPINTDTEQTITETNNNEQKNKKSKLPLYIVLVAVLGGIGFLGTQWLNKQPIEKNEKPTTAKLDSIAFSKLNTTNKDSLQFFIDKFKESEYTTIAQAKLDSIIKIEESINSSNKVKVQQKEIELAWQKAKRLHTSSSYTAFIGEYPNSKYTSEARNQKKALIVSEENEKQQRIRNQEIELAWQKAKRLHTTAEYGVFIDKYPASLYTEEAKYKREKLIALENTKQKKIRYKSYKVNKGETLFSISKKIGFEYKYLIMLNPDVDIEPAENTIIIIPNNLE